MKFKAKASADFEVAPEGNHVAICNGIIDFGLQPGRGMYPAPKHEVYLRFELPDEVITYTKDGKQMQGPMVIGRRFTASMSEKANLRKFLESWFSKKFPTDEAAADFDLAQVLGRKCLLNITHHTVKDKTYANIQNATPIPKSMTTDVKQANPSLYYSLEDPDPQVFAQLPEWMQKAINGRIREEQQPRSLAAADEAPFDDDIPF